MVNFLKVVKGILVLVFMLWWLLAGWPPIWQNPRIPPLDKAQAASGDVILLWDTANGAVPTGWTCISCSPGDAYYGVFPRAAASYGSSTAGADTHTHTLTYSSATAGSSGTAKGTNASNKALVNDHTHSWGSVTTGNGDVRPPFKNLNFIYKNNPTTIPANVIGIFDSGSLPSGWTRYSALDGNYLRGFSDNATGGATTHIHTISAGVITSGSASKLLSDSGSSGTASTDTSHTLPVANTDLTAAANAPPYVEVIFAYNSSGGDTSIPEGLIAMFDTTPTTGWTVVSDASPWVNNFLKGASTYGGTGGSSADHNHGGSINLTSDNSSSSLSSLGTTGAYTGAHQTHSHTVTYTIPNAGSLPVYRDTIFAKYSAPAVISVSVSDGVVSYGTVAVNTSKDTTSGGVNDTQTATNDGNVTENLNIKGQNSINWTLAATAGSDQYVHEFCISGSGNPDPCDTSPSWTALTTNYQTLATGIAVSGTQKFDLKITTPSSTNYYTEQSVDVTIQAVQ